jgi:hypothetical protein
MKAIERFVIDAFRTRGGLVEEAGPGRYDVVLPEELAGALGLDAFFTAAFEDAAGGVRLDYGHPAVRELIALCRSDPAPARLYANHLRLTKRGLGKIAMGDIIVPRGRIRDGDGVERVEVFHYARFNFRATLTGSDKHERIASVTLAVQTGEGVDGGRFETASLRDAPDWSGFPPAPAHWIDAPPLSEACLSALLDRAASAAVASLRADFGPVRRNAARYLELDRARLNGYYDDLRADMERRMARAEDEERAASLRDRMAALERERETKLADAEARYRLRLVLDLINVLIIEQPVIVRDMAIQQGREEVPAAAVWDPLVHELSFYYDREKLMAL